MSTEGILRIGDVSYNGQVEIVDEDRLCYLVKSRSRGSEGLRTISKALLSEYINYFADNPESNANTARDVLCGQTDIDKFEYGYTSTLTLMAKMALSNIRKNSQVQTAHKKVGKNILQQIFYGAPGTGKSFTINRDTKGEDVIRTTFHPDTDYSSFVGAYKPTTIEEPVMTVIGTKLVPVENAKPEKKIIYEFVCQAFLQAYIGAWRKFAEAVDLPKKQFLVIEEINRGNCAQIFGDLFQLLDRNSKGFSDYPITADTDMKKQLKQLFEGIDIKDRESINALYEGQGDVVGKVLDGDILLLPNNLYIWATMNTSDQSLFPIDSAFKRRWNWRYIPISNRNKGYHIKVNGNKYDWWQFLIAINDKIWDANHSEDKKLGYFFVKANDACITAEMFVGKVIFYLWNDVFKDFIDEAGGIFNDEDGSMLSFDKFYETLDSGETKVVETKVERFLKNLNLEPFVTETDDVDTEDEAEVNGRVKYMFNGDTFKRKAYLGKEIMTKYLADHKELTFQEIKETFPDSLLEGIHCRGLIASEETQLGGYDRYYSPERFVSADGVNFRIFKQWDVRNIGNIINFGKNQGWTIEVIEA